MYKLAVVDLDGTLLNSYGVVTDNSKKVIKETIENGTDVIVASGRTMMEYLKKLSSEIGSKKYFIAGNGALIYDIQKDKILYKNYLSKSKVLDIIKVCEENSIFYNVYTEDAIITKSLKYNALYYYKENLKKEESKRTTINVIDDPYTFIKSLNKKDIIKMTICDENKYIFDSIIKKLRQIDKIEVLDVSQLSKKIIKQGTEEFEIQYFYTEVSMADVNKWNAIEYLMNKLEIKKEEVIAIGDNVNDIKMVENAGVGIAMGESTPELKKIADFVTDDNNSEGVAKALQTFCTT